MSTMAPAAPSGATRYMQGIAVPATSVNPTEFMARTRRKRQIETARTFAGLGQTDLVEIKKSDIIYGLVIRFVGTVTSTPGSGTVATTARWPYDLIRNVRFSANGQTNVINVSGAKLKVREFMKRGDLSDRGIAQSVAGATVNQGTLSASAESWGVGSRATAIGAGTYDVDIEWYVPIAEDDVDLMGAIFAQTSSTDLTLNIDWATSADLFVFTGNGAAAVNGSLQVHGNRCSIPLGADGQIVVPDLSVFHSMIQARYTSLSVGDNEIRISGQGAGKTLLRLYSQLWNGANPAPLAVTAANYGRLAWRFSGNETPDEYVDGGLLRMLNERDYNVDIGKVFGFWCHDFAVENSFRDTVDLGAASEFRQTVEVKPAVTLTNAAVEYVTETIFAAGAGA